MGGLGWWGVPPKVGKRLQGTGLFECLSRFHFSLNMFTVLFMMLIDKRNKIFWSADIFVGLLNFLIGQFTFQKNTIECWLLTFLSVVPHPNVFY